MAKRNIKKCQNLNILACLLWLLFYCFSASKKNKTGAEILIENVINCLYSSGALTVANESEDSSPETKSKTNSLKRESSCESGSNVSRSSRRSRVSRTRSKSRSTTRYTRTVSRSRSISRTRVVKTRSSSSSGSDEPEKRPSEILPVVHRRKDSDNKERSTSLSSQPTSRDKRTKRALS